MQPIPLPNLAIAFLPVLIVIAILFAWSVNGYKAIYAVTRMVLQLLLVGYVLVFIFDADSPIVVLLVVSFMLITASWIALHPLKERRWRLWLRVLASLLAGSLTTGIVVTQLVLQLDPPWHARFVVPLAGMILANAMNCVSLAAERYQAERANGIGHLEARQTALRAALIPITNSLFSVGIVSLPGMMTGQILEGVSPLIAVRYQIMVMCMVFSSGGIAAASYLWSLSWGQEAAGSADREPLNASVD